MPSANFSGLRVHLPLLGARNTVGESQDLSRCQVEEEVQPVALPPPICVSKWLLSCANIMKPSVARECSSSFKPGVSYLLPLTYSSILPNSDHDLQILLQDAFQHESDYIPWMSFISRSFNLCRCLQCLAAQISDGPCHSIYDKNLGYWNYIQRREQRSMAVD